MSDPPPDGDKHASQYPVGRLKGVRPRLADFRRASRLASAAIGITALWFDSHTCSSRNEKLEAFHRWGRRTLNSLEVHLTVKGWPPTGETPLLIAANHISWLDICVLCAAVPTIFVAAEKVSSTILMGGIAQRMGTLFHERGNIRDAARVRQQLVDALREGWTVTVFPEGRTGDGKRLMPFFAGIMQSAIDARATVQPLSIRYVDQDGLLCEAVPFPAEQTFRDSLRGILNQPSIVAEVTFLQPVSAVNARRRDLAEFTSNSIASSLGLSAPSGCPDPSVLREERVKERLARDFT